MAISTPPTVAKKPPNRRGVTMWCYLFLTPALILSAMFMFYPMIASWWFSTLQWSGFTSEQTFIGFGNYLELIDDPLFWGAFGRSMIFVFIGTPIRVGLALLVAIVLNNQVLKLSNAFRTMFFLPVMASAAVIGVVVQFMMSPNNGPINHALSSLTLIDAPIEFLSNPDIALWTVLGVHTWKNFGITMIYWLAALQTVPRDYYEAAKIDGAGVWKTLKHITVPILIPFALIILVLTANQNLQAFALVQAMTGGGPYFSTQVIEVFIYQTAFAPETAGGVPRLGYASAAGVFFGVVTLVIALAQFWVAKKVSARRQEMGAHNGS